MRVYLARIAPEKLEETKREMDALSEAMRSCNLAEYDARLSRLLEGVASSDRVSVSLDKWEALMRHPQAAIWAGFLVEGANLVSYTTEAKTLGVDVVAFLEGTIRRGMSLLQIPKEEV